MFNLAKKLKQRKVNNKFQKKLETDIKKISTTKEILIRADKNTNYYQILKDDYNRMLLKKIREEYKKCDNSITDEINTEAYEIAKKLSQMIK